MKDFILETIKKDSELIFLLENIKSCKATELKEQLEKINNKLFHIFCKKDYLTECEPEYCSYRITSACPYVEALSLLKTSYGIDIINSRLIK